MGLVILDGTGRRLFNTSTSLASQLAVDSAWARPASEPVVFVPPLVSAPSSSSSTSDTATDEDNVWEGSSSKPRGAVAVQIERRGLRYILPITTDVDPSVPLQYLVSLHEVFEAYVGGQATEQAIKDHFDLILCLISHTITPDGRPVCTTISQLKEMVPMPGKGVNIDRVVSAVNQAGLNGPPAPSNANLLISSPLPWRRTGIRYASNEVYFDLVEHLAFLLSSQGKVLHATVDGKIATRSKLSGMPDLELNFADPAALSTSKSANDVSLHPCVRSSRWSRDRVVSFVPPDGNFDLLYYSLPLSNGPLPFPFSARATSTSGAVGGSVSLSISPRRRLANVVVTAKLPRGATNITLAESASSSSSASRAHFEVVACTTDYAAPPTSSSSAGPSSSSGTATPSNSTMDRSPSQQAKQQQQQYQHQQMIKWTLLDAALEPLPASRAHVVTILYQHPVDPAAEDLTNGHAKHDYYEDDDNDGLLTSTAAAPKRPTGAAGTREHPVVDCVELAFDVPDETFTNVRVQSVKLVNTDASYSLYKGLKNKGRAQGTVRCH